MKMTLSDIMFPTQSRFIFSSPAFYDKKRKYTARYIKMFFLKGLRFERGNYLYKGKSADVALAKQLQVD